MKHLTISLVLLLSSANLRAQDITGQWNGLLKFPGGQLRIELNIQKQQDKYTATMSSPDQGSGIIPVNSVELKDSVLSMDIRAIGASYTAKWDDTVLKGDFKQNGANLPLTLSRETLLVPKILRPQEPKPPFAYYTEELKFENKKNGIILAGTLSMPAKTGKYPVVVLISGSGPQNRDEEIFGHKPFLVLADHLTKNGIAVLRYDDRGTGESTGKFENAITPDFASDVSAAVDYLKTRPEIDQKQIGLIGHSEGGMIAPMIAAKSKDVSYIVLLAGPGIPGDDILALQSRLLGKASGLGKEILDKGEINNRRIYGVLKSKRTQDEINRELTNILNEATKELPAAQQPPADKRDAAIAQGIKSLNTPWNRFFVNYDPAVVLQKVKCPVLALNGEYDLQVPPKENLEEIKKSLEKSGNKNFLVKEIPKLNHLFQESKTGSPNEYALIEQTFAPIALSEITTWILLQTKK